MDRKGEVAPLFRRTAGAPGRVCTVAGVMALATHRRRDELTNPQPTNALDHEADIAKVHEWFGHANIATTRLDRFR